MALIVELADVKKRLGLPEVDAIDEALASALAGGHTYLQGLLQTGFEKVEGQIDVFYLDEFKWPVIPNGMFRLRLKYGFVRPGSVVLLYGDSAAVIDTSIDVATARIDYERGIVYVPEEHVNTYVSVMYDAGFETEGDDYRAPEWLKEAMLAFMPAAIHSTQPTDDAPNLGKTSENAAALAGTMIEGHLRNVAFALRPIFDA